MDRLNKKLSLIIIFLGLIVSAQQTPAPRQSKSILIVGAMAHIGNGQVIENASIGFDKGKLIYVGSQNDVDANSYATIIEAKGKHVYPGFIVANTTSGLVEVDAVKATRDHDEVGLMLPHIRSLIAYNAESKVTESLRPNGVLIGQISPRGGTISGTSSVVQFDAWNWEDAAMKIDDGIHINWPSSTAYGNISKGEDRGPKANKVYLEKVDNIKSFMTNAKAYGKGEKLEKNLPFEATQGLFSGSQNFYIHVEGEKEITDAVVFCKEVGIKKVVIVNGSEAHLVADLLVENNIPVIINRSHRLPSSSDEDINLPFKQAGLLMNKGVVVCIGVQGQMERMQSRNLPFYAGTCATYGLNKEDALKLITSNPAKILGIDEIVGTLEVGKNATLFISEGDALDMRTNILSKAFIDGRDISLETHQTKLWKRYKGKYSLNNQ